MRRLLSWLLGLVLVLALSGPLVAFAQATGGSFGGGDFSGGGGSSGGGSSGGGSYGGGGSTSWGGGSSSGTSWSTSSGSSSGGGEVGCLGGCGGLFCMLVILGVILLAARKKKGAGAPTGYTAASAPGAALMPGFMQLSALQIGLDWRARKNLQDKLAQLAASGQAGSREGRANLLRETVLSLRREEISWLYVGYREQANLAPQQAEQAFMSAGNDARARFRHETVRDAGGMVQQSAAPEMRAQKNEGEGTVVVTLVVVARRALRGIAQGTSAHEIRAALEDRGSLTAEQLVALEVVWSPAAENDRMSSAELEQHYPEMRKIDPNSIAGRYFCQYCTGPFPMELLNCPHCGGPAPKGPATGGPGMGGMGGPGGAGGPMPPPGAPPGYGPG